MFGAKPLASLSSGLLARKGQARPAMRPQLALGPSPHPVADDLGWNDMGGDVAAPLPPVLAEREALKEEIEKTPPPAAETPAAPAIHAEPVSAVPPDVVERIGREAARGGKAAFTLRLPPDRHLRLRLASAVRHRSAQAIVTEALDAFLRALPEVEELAQQCPAPFARGTRP